MAISCVSLCYVISVKSSLNYKLIYPFRLQWVALLEFSHNKEVAELSWQNMDRRLPRTDKLREMVRHGIPHSLRPQIWMRMSGINIKIRNKHNQFNFMRMYFFIIGALQKKCSSEIMYKDIVKASSNDALMTNKQIEKDLLRIMPANACFSHLHSTGIPRLRRVMRALAWLYPDIGCV